MSDHRGNDSSFLLWSLLVVSLAGLASADVLADETGNGFCAEVDWLALDTAWRGRSDAPGHRQHFELDVPEAGVLILEVSAPARASTRPRLTFSSSCGRRHDSGGGFHRRQETPASAIVEIWTPGTYFLTVAPEDPRQPLGSYTLRNAFLCLAAATDGVSTKEVDPWDDGDGCPERSATDGVPTKEVDPWDDGDGCPARSDGHGSLSPCATALRLGQAVGGEIASPSGDDQDHFSFVLDALETVEIHLRGGDAYGTLYDDRGQRLAPERGDVPGDFRIFRTLGPGRYYLRVESWSGEEGPYVLRIDSHDRPRGDQLTPADKPRADVAASW